MYLVYSEIPKEKKEKHTFFYIKQTKKHKERKTKAEKC